MYYVLVLSAGMFVTAWMIWQRIDRPKNKRRSILSLIERKDD